MKKFIDGLLFGVGFSIAYVAIWSMFTFSALPRMLTEYQPTPDLSKGHPAEVAPTGPKDEREYTLRSKLYPQMKVPDGGGILSIAIIGAPKENKRPSTFQVWLTENKIFKIRTDEETPIIEEVPYPESDPVDYLDALVRTNAGLRKGNSTMTIGSGEVQLLKNGIKAMGAEHMNGALRITTSGVVFFMPNEYEK